MNTRRLVLAMISRRYSMDTELRRAFNNVNNVCRHIEQIWNKLKVLSVRRTEDPIHDPIRASWYRLP